MRAIRDLGAKAGIALNPATPLGALEEVLPLADFVLVMSVNPGFGGQTFLPAAKTGLGRDAKVSSHVLVTIDKGRVTGERAGFLNKSLMKQVGGALKVQLAL